VKSSINYTHFLSALEAFRKNNDFTNYNFFEPPIDEDTALALCYAKYLEGYYDTSGETPVFKIRFAGRAYK
jgi:hypothetical protein